jgi:hypothetical protein
MPSVAVAGPSVAVPSLLLPSHLVGYIASFIKINFDSNLLLNMYKAFESVACESFEDPLCYYKAEVQAQLAALAIDGVILDERDAEFGLTQREMMYVFDCYYCDPAVIMYGEETYEIIGDTCLVDTTRMQRIESEFLDCSEFTEQLVEQRPYYGIKFGLSDAINMKMYKYIRLLEEALRLKSTSLIAYMKDKMVISPDMLVYIYIKHNHQVHAPDWYSLASDDLLLSLLNEMGVLPEVLGMAICGNRFHYVHCEEALKNVVLYNLEAVKKIVPAYISASSQVIAYEDFWDDDERRHIVTMTAPYYYWLGTYTSQVQLSPLSEPSRLIPVLGSDEIGVYLKGLE